MSTAVSHSPASIREWKWSQEEKAIAHKAFDKALKYQLDEVMQQTKNRAAGIQRPAELWDLEAWLSGRRREIDKTFDFRYSVLPYVFAGLLKRGLIKESDLIGLKQEKLEAIRLLASF